MLNKTVCFADLRALRTKQTRALLDANPTPFSKRLGSIMDQSSAIKSARECNETLLSAAAAALPGGGGGGRGGGANLTLPVQAAVSDVKETGEGGPDNDMAPGINVNDDVKIRKSRAAGMTPATLAGTLGAAVATMLGMLLV